MYIFGVLCEKELPGERVLYFFTAFFAKSREFHFQGIGAMNGLPEEIREELFDCVEAEESWRWAFLNRELRALCLRRLNLWPLTTRSPTALGKFLECLPVEDRRRCVSLWLRSEAGTRGATFALFEACWRMGLPGLLQVLLPQIRCAFPRQALCGLLTTLLPTKDRLGTSPEVGGALEGGFCSGDCFAELVCVCLHSSDWMDAVRCPQVVRVLFARAQKPEMAVALLRRIPFPKENARWIFSGLSPPPPAHLGFVEEVLNLLRSPSKPAIDGPLYLHFAEVVSEWSTKRLHTDAATQIPTAFPLPSSEPAAKSPRNVAPFTLSNRRGRECNCNKLYF